MFKVGDKVLYGPRKLKATVIRAWYNGESLVEFEDKGLIPPQMDVLNEHLALDLDNSENKNSKEQCPRCGGKWTETWISRKAYYDCLKCNIKMEDI